MSATQRSDAPGRILGYGGLLLAIAGSGALLVVTDASTTIVVGLIGPLLLTVALLAIPATRNTSLTWLITAVWCGLLAAMTFFSVGIIFLIATVFLLAAFLRANW
jgi:hypothetical protein